MPSPYAPTSSTPSCAVARRVWSHRLGLLLLLAGPSLYALLTVPPLWGDCDGFYHVTGKLSYLTILQWPPLYPLAARLPLALFGGSAAFPVPHGQGSLRDAAIFALVACQHALLVWALYRVCRAFGCGCRRKVWVCAVAFVLSPPWYAFAQCVGSEALGNVTLLWTAVTLTQLAEAPGPTEALRVLASLTAGILTRHIQAVLIALPALQTLFGAPSATAWNPRRRPRGTRACLSRLLGRGALGLLAYGLAAAVVGLLCRQTGTANVSRMGYAFQWRLGFLSGLTPETRRLFLGRTETRLADPLTTRALETVRATLDADRPYDPEMIFRALDAELAAAGVTDPNARRPAAERRLNRLAIAVLRAPDPAFVRQVLDDFSRSLRFSPADLSAEPFLSTDWLRARREEARFAAIRHLRGLAGDAAQPTQPPPYFRLGAGLPIGLLGITATVLTLLGLWRDRQQGATEPRMLPLAWVGVGALAVVVNCALTFCGARVTLPTYGLFLLANLWALGKLGTRSRSPERHSDTLAQA